MWLNQKYVNNVVIQFLIILYYIEFVSFISCTDNQAKMCCLEYHIIALHSIFYETIS